MAIRVAKKMQACDLWVGDKIMGAKGSGYVTIRRKEFGKKRFDKTPFVQEVVLLEVRDQQGEKAVWTVRTTQECNVIRDECKHLGKKTQHLTGSTCSDCGLWLQEEAPPIVSASGVCDPFAPDGVCSAVQASAKEEGKPEEAP